MTAIQRAIETIDYVIQACPCDRGGCDACVELRAAADELRKASSEPVAWAVTCTLPENAGKGPTAFGDSGRILAFIERDEAIREANRYPKDEGVMALFAAPPDVPDVGGWLRAEAELADLHSIDHDGDVLRRYAMVWEAQHGKR